MPTIICRICSKKSYIKPYHLKIGGGKYCSRKCQTIGQRRGKFINCYTCNKLAWKMPKELKHSKSGKFFCTKRCQTIWRNVFFSGEKHPFWKGGLHGYRHILLRSHAEQMCKFCKLKDKRILAVHHLDKNRMNNKI